MTTTLAPPPSSTRSAASPAEPHEDWPTAEIVALRRDVRPQHQPHRTYIERRRRFWLLDAARRDAVLGSTAAFLVSLAIAWALSGVMAYFAALWMYGPSPN